MRFLIILILSTGILFSSDWTNEIEMEEVKFRSIQTKGKTSCLFINNPRELLIISSFDNGMTWEKKFEFTHEIFTSLNEIKFYNEDIAIATGYIEILLLLEMGEKAGNVRW